MKSHLKKLMIFPLCVMILLCMTSCYHFESNEKSDYNTFKEDLYKVNDYIYSYLPTIENDDVIDEVYLFYSDWDLLDSFYTTYVNCVYSEEEYQKEKDRLTELFADDQYLSDEALTLNYPSLMHENSIDTSHGFLGDEVLDMMKLNYVLFDEENFRIVYITIFDKELNSKSVNIPEEYLPKELVELRKNQNVIAKFIEGIND